MSMSNVHKSFTWAPIAMFMRSNQKLILAWGRKTRNRTCWTHLEHHLNRNEISIVVFFFSFDSNIPFGFVSQFLKKSTANRIYVWIPVFFFLIQTMMLMIKVLKWAEVESAVIAINRTKYFQIQFSIE